MNRYLSAVSWSAVCNLKMRMAIANFAVIVAVLLMTLLDLIVGIPTVKLIVPHEFHPTEPTRGWLVPLLGGNPLWSVAAAVVPALLYIVLIYMDHLITGVISNRRVYNMQKGYGYYQYTLP